MSTDTWAFGPPKKPRFGFIKRHRIVAFVMSLVLAVSAGAFAAWLVTSNLGGAVGGKVGTITAPSAVQLSVSTDVTSAACLPNGTNALTCDVTVKVNNASGQPMTLTNLSIGTLGSAFFIANGQGTCAGGFGTTATPGTNDFLVAPTPGSVISPGVNVPTGTQTLIVPGVWTVNKDGSSGSGCAGAVIRFPTATGTFST